ncbi:POU-domain protein pdm3 isoform X3 [Leptinotarsa decemlineata]|uniref:POU-domain protein pdm3 isoform X3 n=1 Tax=Leptinotarsa decemlineata TaxID=7539 RepID=UPI003D30695D
MAEGSVEEDSGEMLGPTLAPVLQTMHTPAPSNLSCKDEESDCESSVGSPEPASSAMGIDSGTDLSLASKLMHNRLESSNPTESKMSPNVPPSHLNGAMAGLVTLQNLQNLASLQSLPQVASLAAGLSNISNLPGSPVVNAPLNLSVSASAATPRSSQPGNHQEHAPSILTNPMNPQPPPASPMQPPNHLLSSQQPAPMPQFILASGHLVQGIQGAQLLIPTSQGLATQTILTIPVNHVNSTDQIVNLALNNGQVMQTSLANLQAMAQSNLLTNPNTSIPPNSNGVINPNLFNPATLTHLLSNGSAQQLLQSLPQILSHSHTNPNSPHMMNPISQPLLTTPPTMLTSPPPPQPSNLNRSQMSTNHLNTNHQMGGNQIGNSQMGTNQLNSNQMNNSNHYSDTKIHNQNSSNLSRNPSPTNLGNGARPSSNGELNVSTGFVGNTCPSLKRSPRSLSPNCMDNSTADLLVDSPNQPTINQANTNVVDGINLDEIKDFAKAFKLRRLSLGLTQTQVGQALSVTEGPAYSQSAICSALASQMFAAAQLSTQQQAMFEKLDITPKSAQKIKPVLERWMKEAEDRYKSGQNHLTDFIGIEPSKKRKRRTSFTPQALELLNAHFERNTHPSGTEITGLAHQLGYEREVIRIWFCNKRQALKNTVRMMSKGMV